MRIFKGCLIILGISFLYFGPGVCYGNDNGKSTDHAVIHEDREAQGPDHSLFHKMLTKEERLWLKSHPVIRVGFAPERPPFEFVDAKGPHGIVPDYFELFAKTPSC